MAQLVTYQTKAIWVGTNADRLTNYAASSYATNEFWETDTGNRYQSDGNIWRQVGTKGASDVTLYDQNGNPVTSFGASSGPNTLAQALPFGALTTWQEYDFPAGSNITYLTVQVFGNALASTVVLEDIGAVVYLDEDSTGARTAVVGDSGFPISVGTGGPIPGVYVIPATGLPIPIPLLQPLAKGTYLGGVVAVRSLTADSLNVMVTAG